MGRNERYFRLNAALSALSTRELGRLLDANKTKEGWGTSHVFTIAGCRVFAKKIPLTRREYDNGFSTRNLFNLPTYYNYGVGSAGFGAYRELLTHVKTTNWVLNGEIDTFPLMYHYRIAPRTAKAKPTDKKRRAAYLARWNDNRAIGIYAEARRQAPYEIWLFLEFVPFELRSWLPRHLDQVGAVSRDVMATIAFMRTKGLAHFDLHLANILTDGRRPFIADFGLALDRSFELTAREQAFFARHTHYDDAEFLGAVGSLLAPLYDALPAAKKTAVAATLDLPANANWADKTRAIFRHFDLMLAKKIVPRAPAFVSFLRRHQKTILLSNAFFAHLLANPRKNTSFANGTVKAQLRRAKAFA